MSRLTIYKDSPVNTTAIPNIFIDEYMKDANEAQLQVYLYLIRMMNAHQATSVSDIADKFNHSEKEVVRALKYWGYNRIKKIGTDIILVELTPVASLSKEKGKKVKTSEFEQETPSE